MPCYHVLWEWNKVTSPTAYVTIFSVTTLKIMATCVYIYIVLSCLLSHYKWIQYSTAMLGWTCYTLLHVITINSTGACILWQYSSTRLYVLCTDLHTFGGGLCALYTELLCSVCNSTIAARHVYSPSCASIFDTLCYISLWPLCLALCLWYFHCWLHCSSLLAKPLLHMSFVGMPK